MWRIQTGRRIDARPLIHDGTIYIGSQDRYLYALDALTGERRWRYDAGSSIAADAAFANGLVLAADLGGRIHAVSADTGARKWRTSPSSRIWGRVSTDGSRVFAANEDGKVMAVSLSDGSPLWSFQAGNAVYGGVVLEGGSALFTSYDGWVYSLDAATGSAQWKAELLWGSNSTKAVGDLVIVGSWDRVFALDARTGRLEWNFWTGGATRSVAAAGDALIFGSDDGYVYSVSLEDGSLSWRYEIGHAISSTPAVSEGLVYVGARDGVVHALAAASGSPVWTFGTGDDVNAPIAVHDGIVYVGSDGGSLYALAAGFPDGYTSAAVEQPARMEFQPLSPDEMRARLREVFASNAEVLGETAVFSGDGKTVYERDSSDLVVEVFENGYYLLTGRSIQDDGWEAVYLTRSDYDQLADELGDPGLKSFVGWCCIRVDSGLRLIMRGDEPQNAATATTAHEAGHALQRLLNPVQSKSYSRDSLIGAMGEAQAYTFEVALIRKIGEYAGVETFKWPDGYRWDGYLAQWREGLRASVDDLTQEHDRGRLMMWQAVLRDPQLAHLREELERSGHVSADSMLDMYYRFVNLTPSEIEPYIESISGDVLSDDLNFIFGSINRRVNFGGIEFADLTLNVPTLVISP